MLVSRMYKSAHQIDTPTMRVRWGILGKLVGAVEVGEVEVKV